MSKNQHIIKWVIIIIFTHSFISCHIAINYLCCYCINQKSKHIPHLKEVDIKNSICYYFDHIINSNDFDRDNILLVEKSHETLSNYDVACKTLYGARPLRIFFDKVDRYIRKYLTFVHSEKFEKNI